jgi:hypothetical protein
VKTWMRNNAIHSAGSGDALPDERTAAVIGIDRFCDECPGTRAHAPGCSIGRDIRQQDEIARKKRERESREFWAGVRRRQQRRSK